MKLATRLKLSALVPLLIAIMIGLALFLSMRVMDKAQEAADAARRIMLGMIELNNFARQYITYQEERARVQFITEYESVSKHISALGFDDPERQQVLEKIRHDSESMKEAFLKLASKYDDPASARDPVLLREAEERLSGRILVKTSDALSGAVHLDGLIHNRITTTQRTIYVLVFFLIVCTTLPVTVLLIRMMRSITESLATLHEGTAAVALGDLDHRIGLETRDEIGELSRAFDLMTERLKETTVSRDELSSEVEERKRVEEELRRSREWSQVTLGSIGDAVIATDESGMVTFLNPVASALTGWKAEDALHQSIHRVFSVINELTRQPAENIVDRVLSERRKVNLANHTALVTSDGREIPIEDSAAPISDSEGNTIGVVLVFHDVTEERRARREIQSIARFPDENPNPVLRISSEGRLLYANKNSDVLLKFLEVDVGGLLQDGWRSDVLEILEADVPREMEIRCGEVVYSVVFRPVSDFGYVNVYGKDITERKLVEQALRESRDELEIHVRERTAQLAATNRELMSEIKERELAEKSINTERQRFFDVLETLPVYICLLTPDYQVPFANRVFRECFGESRGLRCFEHLFGRSEPCEVCDTYKVLKTMAPHEWEWLGPDGRTYNVFDFPFRDTDGSTLILEMGIDITERQQAEAKLRTTVARLELINQELQEFAFIASHDLQEPLRKIQSFGDMLRTRCGAQLGERGADYLSRMERAATRMRQLIQDLLQFSRVASKSDPYRAVDVNAILEDVIQIFEHRIAKDGAEFEISDLPTLDADETLLKHLFQNLIGNSLKYRKETEPPRIRIYSEKLDNKFCRIVVEDNGIGFEEEYVDKIFAPFQRLHARGVYEGTGMGLAICRKIVERHGGTITARSKPGGGAVFMIDLPVHQS